MCAVDSEILGRGGEPVHFSPRQMTSIALVATTTSAIGYLLYVVVPIPGLKFALLAPLLSLMVALPVFLVKRSGTIIATCLVLAAVMGLFNLIMSIAIVMAGAITELSARFMWRNNPHPRAIRSVAAMFPTVSLLVAATLSHYVTGRLLFDVAWPILLVMVVLTQGLGEVGAWVAEQVLLPRILLAKQRWERE